MRFWKDEEIMFLNYNWKVFSDESISKMLDRTTKSVFMKRQRLKIVDSKKKYMQSEEYKKIMKKANKEKYVNNPSLLKNISLKLKEYHKKHPEALDRFKFKKGQTKGDKHWNWKGGISSLRHLLRTSAGYIKWRKSVFERDNYTCQECNERGGNKNAHHLIPFSECLSLDWQEEIFDIDNGLTLCEECHHKTFGGLK